MRVIALNLGSDTGRSRELLITSKKCFFPLYEASRLIAQKPITLGQMICSILSHSMENLENSMQKSGRSDLLSNHRPLFTKHFFPELAFHLENPLPPRLKWKSAFACRRKWESGIGRKGEQGGGMRHRQRQLCLVSGVCLRLVSASYIPSPLCLISSKLLTPKSPRPAKLGESHSQPFYVSQRSSLSGYPRANSQDRSELSH